MGLLDKLFGTEEDDRVVRPPEFAGVQYADDGDRLRSDVEGYLAAADPPEFAGRTRGLVVPFGDYDYAGPIMGEAYAAVEEEASFDRILLLAASSRVPFRGLAVAGYDAMATPMGESSIDLEALRQAAESEDVRPLEAAFEPAAALELQFPFLQHRFADVPLFPVLVGDIDPETVESFLERFWDESTLLVVSSNLSSGLGEAEANSADRNTIAAVEATESDTIGRDAMSARMAIRGMLRAARQRELVPELLDYRTSAETAGEADRVVGYGAFRLS